MTIQMYKILDFPTMFEKVKHQKLPFKTSYQLTLLAQEMEKHINYYQEQFRSILEEYGEKDEEGNYKTSEDGTGILLNKEKQDEAYSKIMELRMLDVELPKVNLNVDDFGNVELSPEEMITFMPFIGE